MLGADDDADGFVAHHPQVALAARRFPGWHVPRTGRVIEALVPAILEQKVTGQEAFGSYRTLVRRFGAPAPGPGAAQGLWVPPDPRRLGADPVLGVADRQRRPGRLRTGGPRHRRGRAARGSDARSARRGRGAAAARPTGGGVWTAAEVHQRALG